MFSRVLERMKDLVRKSQYVMTLHGSEEMEADCLSIFDVEHCILTGKILRRQRSRSTHEEKYLVEGRTLSGDMAVVVAKIGPTGKLVIITVYLA